MTRIHNPAWAPSVAIETSQPGLESFGTLENRRLAILYNGWERWQVMLRQLRDVLAERFPGIKIEQYLIPRGYAAPDDLLQRVRRENDVALVTIGNCGSCTAWSHHDSVVLRDAGMPTVWVISKEFETLARNLRATDHFSDADLPTLTFPVDPESIPEAEGRTVMGDFIPGLIDRLVGKPTNAGLDTAAANGNGRFLEAALDESAAFDLLYEAGVTDGLPVIIPSEPRVSAMLSALGNVDPAEVIANLPPMMGPVTYESVAVNAVMAGCKPSYMPLLVAQVKAASTPAFNLHGIATTTGPTAPMTIVSGPIRHELDINSGRGLFGPGWRANATIGRFLRLLMINVGGVTPAEISKAVMGTPGRYTFCFAEREEASPWSSLQADRGFSPEDSSVTLMGAMSTINVQTGPDAESMLVCLGDALAYIGNLNVMMGRGTVLVVLTPGQAEILAAAGYSKRAVQEGVFAAARIPIDRFPARVRPRPPNVWIEHEGHIQVVKSPDHILVVVAGGPEPRYAHVIATHPSVVPVTVSLSGRTEIGPKNWIPASTN